MPSATSDSLQVHFNTWQRIKDISKRIKDISKGFKKFLIDFFGGGFSREENLVLNIVCLIKLLRWFSPILLKGFSSKSQR